MEEWKDTENQGNGLTGQEPDNGKKRSFSGLKIGLGVLAVLVIGCIVAFCHPGIRRQILMKVSPKKYYVMTEVDNIEDLAEDFSALYEKYVKQLQELEDGTPKYQTELKLDVDDSIVSLFELEEFIPIDLTIAGARDPKNNKQQIEMNLNLAGEDLIGANALMNLDADGAGDMYIQVPQLSSSYIYTSGGESSSESKNILERYQKAYNSYLENPTDKDLLEKLINRYGKILAEAPEEVSIEKNADYSLNNEIQKMTKVTVTVTEENLKKCFEEIIETAKNDDELKQELIRLEACTEEEYLEGIEKLEKELEDSKTGTDKFVMDVWVDKDGKIVGREAPIEEDGKQTQTIYYHTGSQDGVDYLEAGIYDSDEDSSYVLKGNSKKGENGYSGEAVIEIKDKTMGKVSFDNVTLGEGSYFGYNGNVTLDLEDTANMTINLTMNGEESKQDNVLDFTLSGEQLCSLEMHYTMEDAGDISYPPAGTIYNTENTDDMMNYVAEIDPDKLQELEDKVDSLSEAFDRLLGGEGTQGEFSLFSASQNIG